MVLGVNTKGLPVKELLHVTMPSSQPDATKTACEPLQIVAVLVEIVGAELLFNFTSTGFVAELHPPLVTTTWKFPADVAV